MDKTLEVLLSSFFTFLLLLNILSICKHPVTNKNVVSMLCATMGLALIAGDTLSRVH